jgi:hypothetical protein
VKSWIETWLAKEEIPKDVRQRLKATGKWFRLIREGFEESLFVLLSETPDYESLETCGRNTICMQN